MTAEEKAREFLNYIGRNYDRLRYNLIKNVTYDQEIMDNAFHDTVVRVYEAVLRNNPEIEDYEKYFFQASRKWYFTLSDRFEKERNRTIRLETSGADTKLEDYSEESIPASIQQVQRRIEAEYGTEETKLFMDYIGSRAMGRTSYKKYGMEAGIPSVRIKDVVVKIKKHLRKEYPSGMSVERAAEDTERIITQRIRAQFEDGLHREEDTQETGKESGEGNGETEGLS